MLVLRWQSREPSQLYLYLAFGACFFGSDHTACQGFGNFYRMGRDYWYGVLEKQEL